MVFILKCFICLQSFILFTLSSLSQILLRPHPRLHRHILIYSVLHSILILPYFTRFSFVILSSIFSFIFTLSSLSQILLRHNPHPFSSSLSPHSLLFHAVLILTFLFFSLCLHSSIINSFIFRVTLSPLFLASPSPSFII